MKSSKFYPWFVVALLWSVALLNYMDRQMLSTMQESIQADIAQLRTGEAFGMLMAIFLWVYGAVSPFAGMAGDRFSRRWLVVGSLFVWSGVTFLMGYATTFEQLFALRAVMGVSEALYLPSALSLIADWHRGGTRSLAVGIHMTGLYVGQAVGGFGGTLASAISWHSAFHYLGIVGMAYAVVLMLLLRDAPRDEAPAEALNSAAPRQPRAGAWAGLLAVVRTPAFWVILLFFAVTSLPGWATKNWLPTLFSNSLDMDMDSAGPLATITIAASSFVGVVVGGIASDRWARRSLRGRIFTSAIGLTLMVPSLLLLGYGHTLTGVVAAGLLFGLGFGAFDTNNMPILCQFVPARLRSTAYGLMNTVGVFCGAMVTTLLGAWVDQGNLGLGFVAMGGVVLLAVAAQLALLRPRTDNME